MIRDGISEAFSLLASRDAAVIDAALRSVWVSIVAVFLATLAGVPTGYLLAKRRTAGRRLLVLMFQAGMSVPTVLIGLVCFGMFSRRGPLGSAELLYTSWAIVCGEFLLALPIITTWTHSAMQRLDPRVEETARTLGARPLQVAHACLNEALTPVFLGILTAFSRCFTELGIAMMVGGNIPGRTRTLTTATALETARGEFARGVAMSLILLGIALLLTALTSWLSHADQETA